MPHPVKKLVLFLFFSFVIFYTHRVATALHWLVVQNNLFLFVSFLSRIVQHNTKRRRQQIVNLHSEEMIYPVKDSANL